MARDGLLYPLRSALSLARKKRKPVRKEDVLVQRNGDWHQVNLEIIPLATPRGEFFLILFESPTVPAGAARPRHARKAGRLIRPRAADDVRLADLRRELAASREYMQSVIEELEGANEELQSANEEILSSNEELQSTNEELDTAREELQSTNEELNTVNEELHSRNQELATVNGDLVNLLGSVQLPIIIVDRQMAVRRFTPAAERLFNLIPGDVGRPIDQINANVVCDDLPELLRMTIEGLEPQAREVQDRRGRWYSLRIRPYRAVDDRLDGAVVTLIDIDDAKRYQRHIERAGDYFRRIVETVTQPLLVLDPDLRVQTASRSFYEVFGLEPERTVGVSILQLSNGLWDVPELRTVLAEAAKDDAKHYLPFEHPLPTVGSRRITLNARGFELDEATHGILIAMDLADERQKGH